MLPSFYIKPHYCRCQAIVQGPSRTLDVITFDWHMGVCAALCEGPFWCSLGTSWMRLLQHVAFQLPRGKPCHFHFQRPSIQARFAVHKDHEALMAHSSQTCLVRTYRPSVCSMCGQSKWLSWADIWSVTFAGAACGQAEWQVWAKAFPGHCPAGVHTGSCHARMSPDIRHDLVCLLPRPGQISVSKINHAIILVYRTTKVHMLCLFSHTNVATVMLSMVMSMPFGISQTSGRFWFPFHHREVYSPAVHVCRWCRLAFPSAQKNSTEDNISCKRK